MCCYVRAHIRITLFIFQITQALANEPTVQHPLRLKRKTFMQQRRLKIFNGKMVQLQGAAARHLDRKRNPLLTMAMLWRVCLRQRRKVVCSVL